VSDELLSYAYLQAGIIESISCILAYLYVFWYYGINPSDLPGLSDDYFSTSTQNSELTINGLTFDHDEQMNIIYRVQTAYYMVLVLSQVFHVWMCRTRTSSVFTHGFFGNTALNCGVVAEICIMIFIVYTPGVITITHTKNIQAQFLLPSLVSLIALWSWNEFRKFCSRNFKGGLVDKLSW
jgi:sodium/potassium-transporting ATPase subunit alpha